MTTTKFDITNLCICEIDEDCVGCYQDEIQNFRYEILEPWVNANEFDSDTPILVKGSGMTWRRISGWAETTPNKIIDTLSLNGDWRLSFHLEGKTLTAVRYSHDEPTGTGAFTFEPLQRLTIS